MPLRWDQIELWKYADEVPVETLYRHYRIATRICMLGFGAGALMATSLVEFTVSREGWLRTISMIVLVATGIASVLGMLPAIIAWAWAGEVEKELTARGLPLPDGGRLQKWLPRTVMKTFYWFIFLLVAVQVIARR